MLVGVRVQTQRAVGHPLDSKVAFGGVDVGQEAAEKRHAERQEQNEDGDLAEGRSELAHRPVS